MFWTVPLSIIWSFSLYALHDIYYCCVYSDAVCTVKELLMMYRGTV